MEYITVKELFKITKGKKVEEIDYKNENSIRYIQIDDLRNNNNIKHCENINKYVIAKKEDIIIAWDGANAGTIGFGIEGAIGSTLAILRKENKEMDTEFCGLFLRSKSAYLREKCTGATIPHIQRTALEDIKIPKISLNKQIEIKNIINKAQELIDKRKEQIQDLDELVKSKFIEMFGNPFDTTKWTIKKLKEISTSISDGSNIDKKYYQKHGEVLFLRIQNVWCNEFRLEDSVYISENVNQDYIDTSLRKGDLLITKIGRFYTKDSSLGRVSLYLGENDKANYSNNIMRVRLKDEVLSEYINSLLNLDDYNQYIRRVSVGGTDKRALSKTLIGDFPIIVPPMELQKKFIDFVNQVDKLKFEMEKSLKELENNFNSLMQKAFKGELF